MKPNRVPDDLIQAGFDAIRDWHAANPRKYLDDRTQMRIVLAAALTLHDQRAEERQQLHDEFGLRVTYISTRNVEGAVGEALGDALAAIDQLDAQPGGVLHRTIIQRPVGAWREIGDGRG